MKALDNLDINMEDINDLNMQGASSGGKHGRTRGGEIAEMEKMLKKGVFSKELSGTLKRINQEAANESRDFDDGIDGDNPMQGI